MSVSIEHLMLRLRLVWNSDLMRKDTHGEATVFLLRLGKCIYLDMLPDIQVAYSNIYSLLPCVVSLL